MSNPDPVKTVIAMVVATVIVAAGAVAYFQISSAVRDVTDEDSPTQDILDTSDKTAGIIFPWLIPGALTVLALILYYWKKSSADTNISWNYFVDCNILIDKACYSY